jgi:hypothetical protein
MSKFVGGHERGKFMELEMFPTIEEEFPIGTIVCLIDPTGMIAELGSVATVTGHRNPFLKVSWKRIPYHNQDDGYYFKTNFHFLKGPPRQKIASQSKKPSCPRCGGELVEKTVNISLFSEKFETIRKCNSCGHCA